MGWQFSYIIVSKFKKQNSYDLLNCLGFKNLKFEAKLKFVDALNAKNKFICIGNINNYLVISIKKMPLEIIKNNECNLLDLIFCLFPKSEVCAIYLDNIINQWGFTIRDKKKVHRSLFVENNIRVIDKGVPLEFEDDSVFQNSNKRLNGEAKFDYYNSPQQEYLLELTKLFFKQRIDRSNRLINNERLDVFSYKNIQHKNPEKIESILRKSDKKWWNFF
jgi:hypothetical protein